MNGHNGNPLTPALCKLVETSIRLKTTNAKILAASLNRSPATIRTEFQRILQIIGANSRYGALKAAEDNGWVNMRKTCGED
jgi:IS30 family transposase